MSLKETEHFQMVPDSVLLDKKLGSAAIRVYAYLAGRTRRGKPTVEVGQRLISKDLGMSTKTVNRALKSLVERNHIEAALDGMSRGRYLLCSDIFQRGY